MAVGLFPTMLGGVAGTPAAFAGQSSVGLGTATSFAVLAGTTVTNTGPTKIFGDLGVSPGTAVTGAPEVSDGTEHRGDDVARQAQSDLTTGYNQAAGRTPATMLSSSDLGGRTLAPGVYKAASALGLTGTVTLDGQNDPAAVFIFQVGSTLITAPNSTVQLVRGVQPCNVFWQVGSSATLGTDTVFVGSILALTSVTVETGTTVAGRVLARNAKVSLDDNVITRPTCTAATTTTPTSPDEGGGGSGGTDGTSGSGTGATDGTDGTGGSDGTGGTDGTGGSGTGGTGGTGTNGSGSGGSGTGTRVRHQRVRHQRIRHQRVRHQRVRHQRIRHRRHRRRQRNRHQRRIRRWRDRRVRGLGRPWRRTGPQWVQPRARHRGPGRGHRQPRYGSPGRAPRPDGLTDHHSPLSSRPRAHPRRLGPALRQSGNPETLRFLLRRFLKWCLEGGQLGGELFDGHYGGVPRRPRKTKLTTSVETPCSRL